jgi:hypothetical protein
MSTHIAISYQIVFSTKDREPVLRQDRRPSSSATSGESSISARATSIASTESWITRTSSPASIPRCAWPISSRTSRPVPRDGSSRTRCSSASRTGKRGIPHLPARGTITTALLSTSSGRKNITGRPRSKRNTENCWLRQESNLTNATVLKAAARTNKTGDPFRVVHLLGGACFRRFHLRLLTVGPLSGPRGRVSLS